MTVRELVEALELEVLAGESLLERQLTDGYCSDLLSDVMARARAGAVWITIQTHTNVVAVASLLNLAAVVLANGQRPDAETLGRATSEQIIVLATNHTAFSVAGRLYALIRD